MNISWKLKTFQELTNLELYYILQLRAEVFIIEQNCPYQDADGKDLKSLHLMGCNENEKLIAYSRIVPAGISFKEISIGRVVSSPAYRGKGVGKLLMQEAIATILKLNGNIPIRIGAQLYLKNFYEGFGFIQCSDEYLEDNIPHIEMLLEKRL